MRKFILAIVFVSTILSSFSQVSDLLAFKKNGKTIRTYMAGSFIEFIHRNGSHVSGTITKIYNDTIYLAWIDVRMATTYWGTQVQDTASRGELRFHYNEIAALPRPPRSFEFVRNGDLFMIIGLGAAFLHTVNGLIQHTTIDPKVIGISLGVAAIGFTMHKLRKYYLPIGKKYSFEYISLNTK